MQKIIEEITFSRESAEDRALESLLHLLHREYGFDFSVHRRPSVLRRVRRRVTAVGLTTLPDYREYIARQPEELPKLFDMLLINVTAFFRDPEAWEALSAVLPAVVGRDGDRPVRVWSAGCSSGEEPYTLAMVLREWLGEAAFARRVQIFATDVDDEALELAHRGVYPTKAFLNLPRSLTQRYFAANGPNEEMSSVADELRRAVVFGRHDLVNDAPLQRVDLLTCRNALMYFNADTQGRILQKLQFALKPSGVLMLGKAEMLLSHGELFSPVDVKMRLFSRAPTTPIAARRKEADANASRERTVPDAGHAGPGSQPSLASQPLVDAWIQASFDASCNVRLVVDDKAKVILANQAARARFALTPADIGRPMSALGSRFRPEGLVSALEKAIREGLVFDSIEELLPNGEKTFLDVHVTPISLEDGANGADVTFVDATRSRHLEAELRKAHLELDAFQRAVRGADATAARAVEELGYVKEKLRRTTATLEATREELAATSEELAATGEELSTMNEELCRRGSELHRQSRLFADVLANLRTGVAVLDRDLHVSIWNPSMAALCQRPANEVERRAFPELDVGLPVSEIASAARACLDSGDPSVLTIDGNRRGETISCVVSVHPLRGAVRGRERVSSNSHDHRGATPEGVIVFVEEVA